MSASYCSVSVVIPCYRCVDTIERAVDSIFSQTNLPFEVILVDDFSQDGTLEYLYDLVKKYPAEWIQIIALNENSGAGSARNKGWEYATGKYIAFLDSDDSWHPCKIQVQFEVMENDPSIVLSGHGTRIIRDELKEDEDVIGCENFEVSKFELLFSNRFSTPTVMLKRDINNRFPEQRHSEDYALWLDIVFNGGNALKIDKRLTYLYKSAYGESGLSSNMVAMQKGELTNYKKLYLNGNISLFLFFLIINYSLLKFFVRCSKVFFMKKIK